ncbi:hypothetical protein PHLGIDRAFT_203354 [Phlebiopsis gigantea 11061_1 CR5-6]|uniref:Uncharacterized protein n=1 Tax=Phlebiopsis gigantea (strain 11061_1 CR5-6) TaxID=745531 RepID=A0A0C3NHF2_PHLG1|nr:hypothetical protein PHLGIDRAFT_203354 [Phlebiopsis gigantea 11061_1 CR5-6]
MLLGFYTYQDDAASCPQTTFVSIVEFHSPLCTGSSVIYSIILMRHRPKIRPYYAGCPLHCSAGA